MVTVKFWVGGVPRMRHKVTQEQVDACYALPKTADRWDYWRRITGDKSIVGPILIWHIVEKD